MLSKSQSIDHFGEILPEPWVSNVGSKMVVYFFQMIFLAIITISKVS